MFVRKSICGVVVLLLVVPLQAAPTRDFGPFYSTCSDASLDSSAWNAAGPVLESVASGPVDRFAFRPFYSREVDQRGRLVTDVLWPLASFRTWRGESDWRVLTAFGHDDDVSDPASPYRVWLLPLVFLGRNDSGQDYGAVFPLGGRIDNWFGRDEVSFILFPLYARSRLNDLQTHHVLWPLISRTTGKDVKQTRVFPFYGYSRRPDAMDRRFVLWPFWTQVRDRRPGESGGGFMLFPVIGHVRMKGQETWMWLPPLFRYTKGEGGASGGCPWPLVQWERGKRDKMYVWPIYGRRSADGDTVSFWVWPFIWRGRTEQGGELRQRFRVFPLYAQESRQVKGGDAVRVSDRYVSVWPLLSYNRQESNTVVRMLDLWPFRDTAPVERNLAPWWTVFSRYRSDEGTGGRVLWGLARWSTSYDGRRYRSVFPLVSIESAAGEKGFREWNVLKGAAGYRRDVDGGTFRLLYFLRWSSGP